MSPSRKILVVEDNDDLLELWKIVLLRLEVDADFASSGNAACEKLEAGFVPDLLMTDFELLDMTGPELIEKFRSRFPAMKCLLVTGKAAHEFDIEESENVHVLLKPVPFEVLQEKVSQLLL